MYRNLRLFGIGVTRSHYMHYGQVKTFPQRIYFQTSKTISTTANKYAGEMKTKKHVFESSFTAKPAKKETKIETIHVQPADTKKLVEEQLAEKKVRKLSTFDKYILVKMGRFKSIDEVPNEIAYKAKGYDQKVMDNLKGEIKEKTFKFAMGFEYMMTFLTIINVAIAIFLYRKYFGKPKQSAIDEV